MENIVNIFLYIYFLSIVISILSFLVIVLGFCDDINSFREEFFGVRSIVLLYFKFFVEYIN